MQKNNLVRVVIDTNIWIHFIISNAHNKLESFLFNNELRILFSSELMDEISACVKKPKLKKFFLGKSSFEEMFQYFDPFVDFIEADHQVKICRDPKDNFLLSLAQQGNADYLITGDKDLLVIKNFNETRILTFSEFIQIINK